MPKKPKSKLKPLNKAAWIRAQPESASAAELVKKAKSLGITLSLAQVYTTRSLARQRGGKQPKAKLARTRATVTATTRTGTEHEHTFRALVVHAIGRIRAQEILNELASIGL